ncbi:hypothetical protein C1A34_06640 [Lactobacillus amylovorus]|nr:hypothetical protein C1A34_06640 [Lactobacillus amylovorus]
MRRSGTIDEVTQKATYTPWSTDNWAEYDTPQISGYTPSQAKVSATTVDGNTQDQTVTITYSANEQSTTAKFVDDDNKGAQVGDTVTLNGKTDQTINTGLEVPVHYELAKDQTIPATYTFKANGNEPIVIHLVHAKKADQNDNNLNKIVTRTINVTNPDGKTNTIKQVAHLRRSGTIDEVTQKATYTPWSTDNWAEYDTPQISGYTPSQAKVSATTVDGNTQDQTVTITYSANEQSTTAKFVDDDNKGAQVGDTVTLNGKTDQTINTGLEVPVHYELAKDQTIPATYTFKANGNEPIVIHLVHAKKADQNDNNLNKIVTRTINVTNPDGKTNTIKQVAHLRRSGTIDEVTQKATYTPWSTDNWAEYDTPQISGYTPSQAKVSATTVDGNTQDQTVTITYSANEQSTTAKFVDDDNKGAQVGDTVTLNGKTDQTINTGLEVPVHYELAKDQTIPATYTFKANGNEPIVIHLVHAKKADQNDNNLNKIVTRTINVTNPDGKTNTIKQVAHLRRSGTIDEVTQKATYTPWSTDNWAEYDTPQISGYTPSQAKVSATTVDGNTQDQTVTITYSANEQSTTAKFVDDDNKGAQVGDTVTLNGKTDQTINTGLEVPVHYELAKDQTIPATYTFKANGNEPIVIHLVHAKKADQNDNNLNKIVTRTINVTNPDGKTNTIKQVAHLRRSGTIDEVTQKATYTPWSTDNWAEYDTPQISGYTPSQAKVSATTVDGNTQDQTVTITYSADDQKASVTYVDDKTGKTLKVDNLNGVTSAKSGYTTKAAIDTYTGLGYTVVSDDTNGKEVVFDNDDAVDQAFTVHLSHGTTTVTPDNPGHPGEPVDPDNPDGPKYPDGTEEYQVKRIGTQIIHYVGASDKTPADNKQTFIFTREITFDNVTGKIISKTPWNVQSHTFGNVDTPVIPGYHADKAVAGGATVTPDDLNKVITVTYAPDGGSGDNPGSNGGGDQGTTPSPDDQPDTTLPSDNNTDKDVEKDKQDKPEKVKKARKIIKTRITKQEHIGNAEKAEPLAEQEHNDQTVASPVKNEANEPQLPQTGEANTSAIGLLGMLVAGFAAILGFESSRSRKHKN